MRRCWWAAAAERQQRRRAAAAAGWDEMLHCGNSCTSSTEGHKHDCCQTVLRRTTSEHYFRDSQAIRRNPCCVQARLEPQPQWPGGGGVAAVNIGLQSGCVLLADVSGAERQLCMYRQFTYKRLIASVLDAFATVACTACLQCCHVAHACHGAHCTTNSKLRRLKPQPAVI